MLEALKVEEFLDLRTLYDVRSPGEFMQGTIPGALSLPLFSDAERAEVGTLYKKNPTAAYLLALQLTGPKLHTLAEVGLERKAEPLRGIFCFRGGQRSGAMAWLFRSTGLPTVTLQGGYKDFRRFVLRTLAKTYHFQVIGGMSGSGKTAYLHKYRQEGKQVIDLEELARHKGSVFGGLGRGKQPTVEAFENALAYALHGMDPEKPIWVEDESRMIGACKIPDLIYAQMKQAPIYILQAPKKDRLERLMQEYGAIAEEELITAAAALKKRLGEVKTKEIIAHIQAQSLFEAATLLLDYYDKTYLHSLEKRKLAVYGTIS